MKGFHFRATVTVTIMGCLLMAAGCGERPAPSTGQPPVDGGPSQAASIAGSEPGPAVAANPPSAPPKADAWLGQWNGPEGTFLKIDGGAGQYNIVIRNLDGPRTFQGRAQGEGIQFERDGVQETLHATDGAATGMKWLQDKKDCLTVREGEGYCRN